MDVFFSVMLLRQKFQAPKKEVQSWNQRGEKTVGPPLRVSLCLCHWCFVPSKEVRHRGQGERKGLCDELLNTERYYTVTIHKLLSASIRFKPLLSF